MKVVCVLVPEAPRPEEWEGWLGSCLCGISWGECRAVDGVRSAVGTERGTLGELGEKLGGWGVTTAAFPASLPGCRAGRGQANFLCWWCRWGPGQRHRQPQKAWGGVHERKLVELTAF